MQPVQPEAQEVPVPSRVAQWAAPIRTSRTWREQVAKLLVLDGYWLVPLLIAFANNGYVFVLVLIGGFRDSLGQWVGTWLTFSVTPPSLIRALDPPQAVPQFPVRVTLKNGDLEYGVDDGLLSVVDGKLLFSGSRTSFSLSRRQASFVSNHGTRDRGTNEPNNYTLSFSVDGSYGTILVEVYWRLPGNDRMRRDLLAALSAWEGHEPEESPSDELAPPRRPDPLILQSRIDRTRISERMAVLYSAAALPAIGFRSHFPLLWALASAAAVMSWLSACLEYQRVAKLQALDRGEEPLNVGISIIRRPILLKGRALDCNELPEL
jgi:hypothetical protein